MELDGRALAGGKERRRWEPGWTKEGVWALWAKGNHTGCDIILILLSGAVQSNLLHPSSPFLLTCFSWDPSVGWCWASPKERLEKETRAMKRAMKEFLFSKEGNVPRDLVNIKPKGQAQEDQTAWEEGGRERPARTHACTSVLCV